jgi:hypothetical protein
MNTIFIRYRIVLFILAGPCASIALTPTKCGLRNSVIEKVSIIGPEDNRKSTEEFAQKIEHQTTLELKNRTIASVRIHCEGIATANIVLKDDILVTAAHVFYADTKTPICKPKFVKDIRKCYVAPLINDKDEGPPYELDPSTLNVGTNCPNYRERGKDWAVIKLKRKILPVEIEGQKIEIKPYSLFDGDIKRIKFQRVLQVGAAGKKDTAGNLLGNIGQCAVARFMEMDANAFRTDCSAKPGNSGSAYLLPNQINKVTGQPEDQFVGMVAQTADSDRDYAPFGPDNYTYGPALTSDLKKAILDAGSQ